MNSSKFLLTLASVSALTACQHNLPMPSGSWSAVNPDGFIPPNTVIYGDVSDTAQSQKKAKSKKAVKTNEKATDGAN